MGEELKNTLNLFKMVCEHLGISEDEYFSDVNF